MEAAEPAIGLRERKKQRVRQEIMEAAIALFRQRGYEKTRVEDILDRAEISLGTFYNYFPSKQALVDQFAADLLDQYVQFAAEWLDSDQPVPERIRQMTRANAQAVLTDPAFMTEVVTRSSTFGLRAELPQPEMEIYDRLADLFAEGQARGELRPDLNPQELARAYSGLFWFTVIDWLAGEQAKSRRKRSRDGLEYRLMRAVDLMLEGCTAK
jgi:AcrR family transcriptional regulator